MTDIEANDTTLRLERMIAVPPETLFALWVDPAQLIKWWAPDGYQASVEALETMPGGRWRVGLHGPDGAGPSMSGRCRYSVSSTLRNFSTPQSATRNFSRARVRRRR